MRPHDLIGAAASCAADMRYAEDAPAAALFTIVNERHTLGLALAELVLAEVGWRPIWIGEGPPADELPALITKFAPRLALVSASAVSRPSAVSLYQAPLMRAAAAAGIGLILAGGGAWKDAAGATRVVAFKELREVLT